MCFWTSPKICPKKGPLKKDNFSHFAKHRSTKKSFVATPFSPKIVVFQLGFFETKNIDVEQNNNLKSGNSEDKKKGFER